MTIAIALFAIAMLILFNYGRVNKWLPRRGPLVLTIAAAYAVGLTVASFGINVIIRGAQATTELVLAGHPVLAFLMPIISVGFFIWIGYFVYTQIRN